MAPFFHVFSHFPSNLRYLAYLMQNHQMIYALGLDFWRVRRCCPIPTGKQTPSFLFFFNQNIAPSCHLVSYLDKLCLH